MAHQAALKMRAASLKDKSLPFTRIFMKESPTSRDVRKLLCKHFAEISCSGFETDVTNPTANENFQVIINESVLRSDFLLFNKASPTCSITRISTHRHMNALVIGSCCKVTEDNHRLTVMLKKAVLRKASGFSGAWKLSQVGGP